MGKKKILFFSSPSQTIVWESRIIDPGYLCWAGGMKKEHRQEPVLYPTFLAHLEPCFMHSLAGISVPVAVAGNARSQRDDQVLQAGGKTPLGTHMFKQQER